MNNLTNPQLAILGLVAEGPSYGYQIEQAIEQRGMREWTEIGFSSIYATLNKLEELGWLSCHKEANTERPARKVYTLTPTGWQIYHDAVRQRIETPRSNSADFALALANLPVLQGEEAGLALRNRFARLSEQMAKVQNKQKADEKQAHLPPHIEALFSHSLALMQAEWSWLDQYLTSQKERGEQ